VQNSSVANAASRIDSAVERTTDQTFYRRFFGQRHSFSEDEIAYFLNIDFASHVALVAVLSEEGRPTIVAGARYILVKPGYAPEMGVHTIRDVVVVLSVLAVDAGLAQRMNLPAPAKAAVPFRRIVAAGDVAEDLSVVDLPKEPRAALVKTNAGTEPPLSWVVPRELWENLKAKRNAGSR
jgi:hypothetical protein